jgi:hypothetical protein
LQPGQFRPLTPREVKALQKLTTRHEEAKADDVAEAEDAS